MNTLHDRGSLYAFIACAVGAANAAMADEAPAPTRMQLRIAAQPLDEALQEFSRQSDIQVVFFSQVTHGARSPGIDGTVTVDVALRALLAGSGLAYRIINSRTVEIYRPAQPLSRGCCDE